MADTDRQEGAAAAAANAEKIVTMCVEAGVPAMAAALIREGVDPDKARARVDGAKAIKAAVDLARKNCPEIPAEAADRYIAAGATIDSVRADLFQRRPEVADYSGSFTAHDPLGGAGGGPGGGPRGFVMPNSSEIYSARAKARAERGVPAHY